MACSNFCNHTNFNQIKASLGYITRAEREAEYRKIQKGEAIYQAMVSASTTDSGMPLEEAARFGGDWTVMGTLGLAIVGVGILTALGDAIGNMGQGKRAHEM